MISYPSGDWHTRNIKAFALRVNIEEYNHSSANDKRLSRDALSRVQYLKLPGPFQADLRTLLVELDEILLGQPLGIRGLELADFLFTDVRSFSAFVNTR